VPRRRVAILCRAPHIGFNSTFLGRRGVIARKYYITTAIDYANANPHLGTAYEKIGADVFARFHRLRGDDVFFLMGNDEHSQNVAKAAREQGLDPVAWCDGMETKFREAWAALDVSFDDFIRTTEPRHTDTVRELLTRIHENGDFYKDEYEGWYCVGCEAFKTERDLEHGECPNHPGKRVDWLEEENYFFRLSKYTDPLLRHYEANPGFVRPEWYRNEMVARLEEGLIDISVSRQSLDWGVPFPFDPGAVTYVWFDALMNYVSGVGFTGETEKYERYWPADVHVIGKDITRFHCLVWPAMLLSAGLPLPECVSVHGFLTVNGQKISKSNPETIIRPMEEAADWGADPIRYFLMREMSWGRDGDYNQERLAERYRADLGTDLGNLLNRVLNMTRKYLETPLAVPGIDEGNPLRVATTEAQAAFVERMEDLDPQGALNALWNAVRRANVYVDEEKPWVLVKEEGGREKVAVVLLALLETLRHVLVLLTPVMPAQAAEGYAQLGLGDVAEATLDDLAAFSFPEGVTPKAGTPLFPRREDGKDSPGGRSQS